MPTPQIFFDEAGNTGAALVDPAQPVFVLASVDYTPDEAGELLSIVHTPQAKEAKFTSLRKSAAGRRRLLDFIRSPLLTPSRAKTMVTHKRYMVVSKLVDIIEETLAHEAGIDLYERGANIALANLHFYVTPTFCGVERFDEWLASFVEMVRAPTADSKNRFFSATWALHDNSSSKKHESSFGPYLYAEKVIDDILHGVSHLNLDPAIPSFFLHCIQWGKQIGGEFLAIHDASKPMAAHHADFESMMDKTIEPALIGYDRRKFEFPLKATGLQFADSRDHLSLQVADLIAGATAYRASAVARSADDELSLALRDAEVDRLLFNVLWPSPDVTPQALGTEEVGGINATEYMTNALAKRRI
jgi:hypothetical protein